MSNPYSREEKITLLEQVWAGFNPHTRSASVRCPNDGYVIQARVRGTEQRFSPIVVSCVACERTIIEPELDPMSSHFRDWTDDEKQELFDRQMQGLPVVCPVDRTRLAVQVHGDMALFHCYRCGLLYDGSAGRRIGSKPLVKPVENDSRMSLSIARSVALALQAPLQVEVPMEKRYQVFVSSPFEDLEHERQRVAWALQRMDCIPSGMEMFPATSDDQWTVIQKVIDECDYYILVLAGKYGSIIPELGISYTEREFKYAIDKKKHVLAFLYRDLKKLTGDKLEEETKRRNLLHAFRDKAKTSRVVDFWENGDQLAALVSPSINKLTKDHPAEGWVRGRYAANAAAIQSKDDRIAELERENAELKALTRRIEGGGKASLSRDVVDLLKAAETNKTGLIMLNDHDDEYWIGSGDYNVKIEDRRGMLWWQRILRQLEEQGIIVEDVQIPGRYQFTLEGYDFVEKLTAE